MTQGESSLDLNLDLNLTCFIQIPLLSHSKGDSLNNALRISFILVLRRWTLYRLL